ncbi:MAG TPA: STAS domain-containing protein [Ignavibacteriaceae bacterium]|nr:STAS domain-containing protein [Ignavibacteriaceae bacterium]
MKVNSYEKFGTVIIEITDNLIGGPEASKINDTVNNLLSDKKNNIIVDLGKVKFVNSSGLGILIRNFTSTTNSGGNFVLANINEKMRGLLSITKLNQVFKVYPTVEEAANTLNK